MTKQPLIVQSSEKATKNTVSTNLKPDLQKNISFNNLNSSFLFEKNARISSQNLSYLHHTIGNQAVGRFIQAKLKIGQPNDKFEQEADSVAEMVMSMPEPSIQTKPT